MEKTQQKASRAVALLVILAMVFALIPAATLTVSASGTILSSTTTWALTGDSPNYILTIGGTGDMPAALANGGGTARPWQSEKDNITTVIIGDDVTSISEFAFQEHAKLANVTIGAKVSSIGANAFCGFLIPIPSSPLTTLIFKGNTPPTTAFDSFQHVNFSNINVTVPSKSAYATLLSGLGVDDSKVTESGGGGTHKLTDALTLTASSDAHCTTGGCTASTSCWAWDATDRILWLDGINLETSADVAVTIPNNATIRLAEGSDNKIVTTSTTGKTPTGAYQVFGINAGTSSDSKLKIMGTGKLTVDGNVGVGIYAYDELEITGGTVVATGYYGATGNLKMTGNCTLTTSTNSNETLASAFYWAEMITVKVPAGFKATTNTKGDGTGTSGNLTAESTISYDHKYVKIEPAGGGGNGGEPDVINWPSGPRTPIYDRLTLTAGTDDKTNLAKGYHWDGTTKTLTLNGINLTVSASVDGSFAAINVPAGTTVTVIGTSNSIVGENTDVNGITYGIQSASGEGALKITGSAGSKLSVEAKNSGGLKQNYGISVGSNKLTVDGGVELTVKQTKSFNISARGITAGSLELTGTPTLIVSCTQRALSFDFTVPSSFKAVAGEDEASATTATEITASHKYVKIEPVGGGQQTSTNPSSEAPTSGSGGGETPTSGGGSDGSTTPTQPQGNQGGGSQGGGVQPPVQQQQQQTPSSILVVIDDKTGINVPVSVGTGANAGAVTVTLNDSAQNKLVDEALKKAEKQSKETPENTDGITPQITLDFSSIPNAKSAVISVEAAKKFSDYDITLAVKLSGAEVHLTSKTLSKIAESTDNSKANVKVEASAVNKNSFKGMQAAQVKGYDKVVNIDVYVGGVKLNVEMTVNLQYKLKAGEKAKGVRALHMDDKGNMTDMGGEFDERTSIIKFTVTHQSYFVVGYDEFMAWENTYKDVDRAAWYYDAVAFASYIGVMQGYGGDIFAPDDKMTRAMFVTILWNLDGKPEATSAAKFSDVSAGVYYDAIMWAVENKIAEATGAGLFTPNKAITRQDMAAILYAYAKYKGYEITANREMPEYTDFDEIAWWAETAVRKLSEAGVFNGMSADEPIFAPKATATRAQVSQTFRNFMRFIVGTAD